MLNWIARYGNVLTTKLRAYAKLNYLKLNSFDFNFVYCHVDWGCRIHRLLLWRGVIRLNKCSRYDTKQSDGEVPGMMELGGNAEYPFNVIAPRSYLTQYGSIL